MRRIHLVTGASGHLGNVLCRRLIEKGEAVRALILPGDKAPGLDQLDLEICRGDLRSLSDLERFFSGLEGKEILLWHLASVVTIFSHEGNSLREVNVEGTKHILAESQKHHVRRLLYVSSVHAMPEAPAGILQRENPHFDPALVVGPYAKSKAEATAAVLQAGREGLDVVVVLPSGIIGPMDYGCGHMTQLMNAYLRRQIPASICGAYDFVDVRDVVNGMLQAMEKGRSGESYLLTGHPLKMDDYFRILARLTGRKPFCVRLPLALVGLVAAANEGLARLLKRQALLTRYSVSTLKTNSLFSHEKATTELGYTVRPVEESLRDALVFIRDKKKSFSACCRAASPERSHREKL